MFKNYLSSIEGISIYPIISLSVFVVFFVLLGYLVFKADKKYIKYMEELPLGDDE
ncbi:MAG: CcoQ/FixQ family Cbb3-type cytochrome c oxidase assembly chaperone [Spirosomaceae bacterium]|nr:CcoQ/FixQ family Cbb3-type cytochrome c oxidase assembly chaperone [Spirosomataceae bacterium]